MSTTCEVRAEARHKSPAHRPWWLARVPGFLVVGLLCTVAYFAMYLVLREPLGAQWANVVALVLSTVADTWGNRRFTFDVHSRSTVVPHQLLGLAVLVLGTVLTSGSLWLLVTTAPEAGRLAELAVLAAANGVAGTVRFAAYARVMRGA